MPNFSLYFQVIIRLNVEPETCRFSQETTHHPISIVDFCHLFNKNFDKIFFLAKQLKFVRTINTEKSIKYNNIHKDAAHCRRVHIDNQVKALLCEHTRIIAMNFSTRTR